MKGLLWNETPVSVENQQITEILNGPGLKHIAPGLVDIQVNGFGGVDFNDPKITLADYRQALKALREHRVTCALPTLITNQGQTLEEQLTRLEAYRAETQQGGETELAAAPFYHLEGPFISPEEGYRGAHPLEDVMALDDPQAEKWIEAWQKAANGRIRIMTFSPHTDVETVRRFTAILKSNGILPAVGHTHASAAQIHAAVEAGAVLATHLGNACAQLLPRHENPIWAALAEDLLSVSMIGDGFHLPPEMLKVFYRMKGRGRTFLISDATQYAGKEPGEYHTHIGGDVVLTPERKLHIKGSPKVLAGAAKSLWEDWKHVKELGFASPEELWFAASGAPLAFLIGKDFDWEYTPYVFV